MVRSIIEMLYKGRCKITVSREVFNLTTKQTHFEDETLCEDEPCRLSYGAKVTTKPSDTVSKVSQTIKLFVRPDLVVKAGSKVEVTQNGRTVKYISSGQPSVYSNHQEIMLDIEGDKA